MAAGSIVVDLLLKTGSFETDTARAAKSLKKFEKDAAAVGKAIGVAFTAAVVGLAALVKGSIDSADRLNDLSKKTGVAVETLGGLGFAASQAGGDLESTVAGLGKLNKTIAEAAAGNKDAVEFFDKLGISVRDSSGKIKDAGKVFLEVADKFASFEDGPNKAALALRGFGKAGLDQISVLNEGGRALQANIDFYQRYGGVTTATARAADEFNDTLGKISLLSSAFGKVLTEELLPSLQGLADLFLKSKESGDQLRGVAGDVASVLKGLAVAAAFVGVSFSELAGQTGALFAQLAALATLDFKAFSNIGKDSEGQLDAAKARFKEFYRAIYAEQRRFENIGGGRGLVNPAFAVPIKPDAPGLKAAGGSKARDEFGPLLKSIVEMQSAAEALLEAEGKLTAAQQLGAKIAGDYAAGLLKITPVQLAQLDAALKIADATQRLVEARAAEESELKASIETNASFLEQQGQIRDGFLEQAKAAQIELQAFGLSREEIDRLTTARMRDAAAALEQKAAIADADGFLEDIAKLYREQAAAIRSAAAARDELSAKEHALTFDSLTGATKAMKDYLAETAKAGEQSYNLVRDAFQGLEDAALSALQSRDAKQAAKAFVDQILSEVYRLYIIKPLLASIFSGNSTSGFASIVSAFAGLFGGGSGGSSGASTVGMSYAAGTNYVPNDGLAFLHKGEAVLTAPQNRAGRGNVTFNIVNNGQPVTAREESRQESSQGTMINLVLDAIVSDVQKGGKAHRALSSTYGLSRTGKKRA